MKSYKVSIVVTKTMWVTEDDFREDDVLGQEFDEDAAINYAKENHHNPITCVCSKFPNSKRLWASPMTMYW